MNDTGPAANDAAQIRLAIDSWAQALRAKNAAAVIAHFASDFRSFDIAPPLQSKGVDAFRKGLEA